MAISKIIIVLQVKKNSSTDRYTRNFKCAEVLLGIDQARLVCTPGQSGESELNNVILSKTNGAKLVIAEKANGPIDFPVSFCYVWGYNIPRRQIVFAHRLIDEAGVDLIHGHSSHHAGTIEVYRDKLILYGCGDFLNDYEGIVRPGCPIKRTAADDSATNAFH